MIVRGFLEKSCKIVKRNSAISANSAVVRLPKVNSVRSTLSCRRIDSRMREKLQLETRDENASGISRTGERNAGYRDTTKRGQPARVGTFPAITILVLLGRACDLLPVSGRSIGFPLSRPRSRRRFSDDDDDDCVPLFRPTGRPPAYFHILYNDLHEPSRFNTSTLCLSLKANALSRDWTTHVRL